MKFLFTIALLALIGCAGNKPAKTLPTCEEFYNAYKGFTKRLSEGTEYEGTDILFYGSLEILATGVEKYNCNIVITCDEKNYCVGPMF